jgi:hypothetical protein
MITKVFYSFYIYINKLLNYYIVHYTDIMRNMARVYLNPVELV